MSCSKPIRVLLTGAAGQIAYSLIPLICKGDVFGTSQPVILHLLDIPMMKKVLDGVVCEIQDCTYPLVHDVIATVDEAEAFKSIDAAFLVGAMPRKQGMERKDLLSANVKIFASQGKALANHSNPNVKVLVVGNPANTNALICAHFAAPKIPSCNITAMTRLDQNRATGQLALQHKVPVSTIKDVFIWGNHSSTQFPDVSRAKSNGQQLPFNGHDDAFIEMIQKRGATVINLRGLSSAMSAAKAAGDHMRDWWCGTADMVSMGVVSDGNKYGVPEGLVYSFPCTVANGQWKIVNDLPLDDTAKSKLEITSKELQEEKSEAMAATQGNL